MYFYVIYIILCLYNCSDSNFWEDTNNSFHHFKSYLITGPIHFILNMVAK